MLYGVGSWLAMGLAFLIGLLHPGIASGALVLGVAALLVLEEISRPTEDGKRSRETA